MIVVDTNVVSEMMRPRQAPNVLAWARAQSPAELRMTTITVAEVRYGIERLPAGRRKDDLHESAERMLRAYTNRILPFDEAAAEEYAPIRAARERTGRPIDQSDAMIAAICKATGSALATRNGKDFDGLDIPVVDPWN